MFAFLSEYEGFGLTPLEALAAGCPPVVLDTPVAREVYGDAAIFVGAATSRRGDASCDGCCSIPATAAPLLERARAVLARYSWDAAADRTLGRAREDRAAMTLSIVIVNFNARPISSAASRRCTASPPAIAHEIIVVDNASTDGSAALRPRSAGPRCSSSS